MQIYDNLLHEIFIWQKEINIVYLIKFELVIFVQLLQDMEKNIIFAM